MVPSRQVEIPYYRAVVRQRGGGFRALAQVIGRTAIPFLRKYVVPAAKRVGADLLELAVPEIAEVVTGRKKFKTAGKSVGKQTLKKPLGEGSRRLKGGSKQRRFFQTKSTEQSSRSRRDIFTNISRWSCQTTIFGTNLLLQCLEILEAKSQLLTMSCPRMNKEFIPLPHLMKTASSLNFKRIGTITLIWDSIFLALKLKFVKGRGYDTYESKEKKKEHKGESVVFTETGTIDEEEEEVARVTYVNNILHSIFSNVEVYINNQQIYNSNWLYAHKSYISNNFKAAISEYKGVLRCEGYDFQQDPEDISNPLPDPFFTKRIKLLSGPDGFMVYGNLGINFFSISELLYPNMKNLLRLIRAIPTFYMISDNPNVSLGIVDCSLYTRRIPLKDDYHKKMDMLAYAPVEYNYLETLAKTFIKPARRNQFIQENIFNNAPIRRIAIAMTTNSAFTGSFTENPFWYHQFDLRQVKILRGGQPIVDFDTADNCRLYVTTMKAMNFQDDIPSIPVDDFKITMCWCLTWLQCKTLLKTVTILNLLENHWDWS